MSINIIPTLPDPYYDEVVNMDGTDFLLTFSFNQRESCYYLSIATPDGDDIANGIKILANWPLLHKSADNRLPPGEMICVAFTDDQSPPGLGQIGSNLPYQLFYVTTNQLPGPFP